jgi:hypothetical protein
MELRAIRNAVVLTLFCGAIASAAGSIVFGSQVWERFRTSQSSKSGDSSKSKGPTAAPYRHTVAKTVAPHRSSTKSWQGWRSQSVRNAIGRYCLGQNYGVFQLAQRGFWHPSVGQQLGKWQNSLKGHPRLGRVLRSRPSHDWSQWHQQHRSHHRPSNYDWSKWRHRDRPDHHMSPSKPGHRKPSYHKHSSHRAGSHKSGRRWW